MPMKNSNDTSWDRTSDLPICSTAPEPLCYRGPLTIIKCSEIQCSVHQFIPLPRREGERERERERERESSFLQIVNINLGSS